MIGLVKNSWLHSPRCSVQSQTSRSASDYSDLAIEGEDGLEVVKLDVGFG